MLRYMLDTDTCSYVMKGSEPGVIRRLTSVPVGEVCISVITQAELMYGVEVSPKREQDGARLEVLLRHMVVLDLVQTATLDYAEIRASLKKQVKMIGANDLLIAAHARSMGLTLVTNNVRELRRVPRLKVENWC